MTTTENDVKKPAASPKKDDKQERLAARLLQCELGRIELTHEQLAADIGTAREVVSRLLKELENNGLIELKRGLVIIRDRKGLEQAAGQ